MSELKAIDPMDCGCTDCITGYSKPLRSATARDIARMITGDLDDRTSGTFTIQMDMNPEQGRSEHNDLGTAVIHADPVRVVVIYQYGFTPEWDITRYVNGATAILLKPEHHSLMAEFKEDEE